MLFMCLGDGLCAENFKNESYKLPPFAALRFWTARSDSDVRRFAGGRPTSETSETRPDRDET
jgi:hypothetical protein